MKAIKSNKQVSGTQYFDFDPTAHVASFTSDGGREVLPSALQHDKQELNETYNKMKR